MTADEARLTLLERQIKHTVNGFENRFKDESFWQKILGFLMFWNRRYMTDFISTFFPFVYWPNRKSYTVDKRGSFKGLAHEWVHLLDDRDHRGWFGFSYISVQVWAIVSVLALLSIWFGLWFLFFLAGLLFLAPWPSPWRLKWEVRGYAMGLAIEYWTRGRISDSHIEGVIEHMTGSGYYFTWWSKRGVRKRLDAVVRAIEREYITTWSEAYSGVSGIVKASDRQVIDAAEANLIAPVM